MSTSPVFYNSLTRTKEPFSPLQDERVTLYHCGPTVYKRPHLGNMRRFLFADFLRRSLEFLGYTVQEITNITDVGHLTQDDIDAGEDKLERQAREQQLTPQALAEQITEQYFADIAALNIQSSHEYPRASQHIPEMIRLTQQLIERGHAYVTSSGVYFDVASFPSYGQLSGNTVERLTAGSRVAVREDKKHPADFALWKLDDPEHLQQWDSPWGRGYPGWHIECSAMSMKYLGETIDIHTGGEDNKFPHHENEIAQSEGATGQPFVRWWLHNGYLQLQGEKLAKRSGEQLTIDSILDRHLSPLAFRLLVLGSHYRKPMDFSWDLLASAQEQLDRFRQLLRLLREQGAQQLVPGATADQAILDEFAAALADDLNTPQALAVVQQYVTAIHGKLAQGPLSPDSLTEITSTLASLDRVLGFFASLWSALDQEQVPDAVAALVQQREAARQAGDFARSDALRDEIAALGWRVEDTANGPRLSQQ